MTELEIMCSRAKDASAILNTASSEQKNAVLKAIAAAIFDNGADIINANRIDIEKARENEMSEAMLDRLTLNSDRVRAMAQGVLDVIALEDPVGRELEKTVCPNGLVIRKVSVPMGVIGIIYESRPNVTSDAASLCLKAGSAVVLRGGKEAIRSNTAIVKAMRSALLKCGFPEDCICLVEDTSRQSAAELMKLDDFLDLLIPRGGAGLIRSVVESSTVPVIATGTGNCHVYVDEQCDIDMAAKIVFNAKTSRVSVCNACETVLVHEKVADRFLPVMKKLTDEKKVELRGCEKTAEILKNIKAADENDYKTEFLDYILAVKIVKNIDEAIKHINRYSTGHSECIVTENRENALRFQREIDSAAVYVNASTRFTDGGEFGFGAEIGISTQKLHARGPMGLREITTYKYLIDGSGQIR